MNEQEYYCKFCGKQCKNKNSLAQHECRCKSNPNRIEVISWNKGQTKETDIRILNGSNSFKKKKYGLAHYKEYLADNSIAWGQKNMQCYKKYFLEEQEHKCAICGCMDIWQEKPLVFILDHIDGNADNNNRDNLRLICPNCDSQLSTYKSKNKNSARSKYRNIKVVTEEQYQEILKNNQKINV